MELIIEYLPMEPHNRFHQTHEWEIACVKTRRSKEKRKKRIRLFSIKKKDKVLDLGCGDGLNISILHSLGIRDVVGVDISKELIRLAKKNNSKTKFYVGSAEKLPFKKETFDVIFVDSVFHHIIDYQKVVKELKRVLKKNGKLCFIEPHKSPLRLMIDFICVLPISKFMPILKERREAYLGEIDFMTHWLATEKDFYQTLEKNKFTEEFTRKDFLSIVGQYKRG